MVGESEKAADLLKEKGIDCEVLNLRSIRPLDRDGILKSLKKTNRLVCVEDGYP
jgi:pyruvate dehydrogenase E1 component beta subunit